ncbi:MAG TPA: hypothetical protein VKE69_12000 [Planctomycetota bacterium]|nr:hypothetical protein [Planctomycetota bacterium]
MRLFRAATIVVSLFASACSIGGGPSSVSWERVDRGLPIDAGGVAAADDHPVDLFLTERDVRAAAVASERIYPETASPFRGLATNDPSPVESRLPADPARIQGSTATQPTHERTLFDSADRTDVNPFHYTREAELFGEFFHKGGDWAFVPGIRYYQPFEDEHMRLRVEVPFVATDSLFRSSAAADGKLTETSDNDKFGIGDVSARFDFLPFVDERAKELDRGAASRPASGEGDVGIATEVQVELWVPTAPGHRIGSEKWVLGPAFGLGLFLENGWIVSPRYQHVFSFAGNDDREDIHEGRLEAYFGKKLDDDQWVSVDPAWLPNYEDHQYSGTTIQATYGRVFSRLDNGGVVRGYVKPGIGLGGDRPYGWLLEFGVQIAGF